MSKFCVVLICLVIGLASPPAAHPCSSFVASGQNEVLLAKNFDWHFESGYLIKNPSGVTRRALPLFGGEPASWTSIHGSLTFTQYGIGLPYGGINQPGLAIEMLWLDETVYPSTAIRTIGELEWIQYQLDTRATVAEVVASVDEFAIRPVGGKIHYMLADASGDKALIEFVDGAARIQRGSGAPLVCTNDTHALSELVFKAIRATKLEGNSSRVRYARLRLDLEGLSGPPSVERGFASLERVAERGKGYRTQWAAVYEVRKRKIHIKPDRAKRAFTIDAAALDYSPQSGTSFQDLFGKQFGNQPFAPLTAPEHRAWLTRNLPKIGLNSQLEAIANHLLEPSTSTVRALGDRATLLVRVKTKVPGAFARIAVFGSQRDLVERKAQQVGSVLLDASQREFAFYNLPKGKYAVGAFHDLNQDGRHTDGEPLAYFQPDPEVRRTEFAGLAFELKDPQQQVEIVLE